MLRNFVLQKVKCKLFNILWLRTFHMYRKCNTLDFVFNRTLQLRHCVGDVFDTSTEEDTNLADLISQNNLAWVSEEKLRED